MLQITEGTTTLQIAGANGSAPCCLHDWQPLELADGTAYAKCRRCGRQEPLRAAPSSPTILPPIIRPEIVQPWWLQPGWVSTSGVAGALELS